MAWTAPTTAVTGSLTAARFNSEVRDNLLQLPVAKAVNQPSMFIGTGANALDDYAVGTDYEGGSVRTTTSSTYVSLTNSFGPSVQITTRTAAIVFIVAEIGNSTVDALSVASCEVSGATTIAADDDWALMVDGIGAAQDMRLCGVHRFTTLTAGSNTFTMKYRQSGGTGRFSKRELVVWPI